MSMIENVTPILRVDDLTTSRSYYVRGMCSRPR